MKPTQNKDLNRYLKTLKKTGWKMECGGRHIKLFYPKSGWPFVVVPKSPSDVRSLDNVKTKIRRAVNHVSASCLAGCEGAEKEPA